MTIITLQSFLSTFRYVDNVLDNGRTEECGHSPLKENYCLFLGFRLAKPFS